MKQKNKLKYIGQYKVIKTLAVSGFSNVYLVEDIKDSNKQYALKALKDSSEKYKLENELNTYKKISKHKNILELSKILQYTHNLNIIHNDIKPSNMLSKNRVYYLGDWGIAINKKEDDTLHIRSDESYVAPEVFIGHFNNKCDIYSLGCSLYYLATGKKVFDIDEHSAYSYIMFAHCCLNVDVSQVKSLKLQYLILQMMQKNPKDRITLNEIENIISSNDTFIFEDRKTNYDIYKQKDCFELYGKLLEKNVLFAYNNLAYMYEITEEKKDINKSMSLYTSASKMGLTKAMYNLAMCYHDGIEVKKEEKKAFYWFRQASLKNHEKAQYYLGNFYEKGLIVEKDLNKASRLYKISAYAGYHKSYLKLKELHKSDK